MDIDIGSDSSRFF